MRWYNQYQVAGPLANCVVPCRRFLHIRFGLEQIGAVLDLISQTRTMASSKS